MFILRMVRRKILCKVVVVVRNVLLFILSYFSGRFVIKVENTSIIHQYRGYDLGDMQSISLFIEHY